MARCAEQTGVVLDAVDFGSDARDQLVGSVLRGADDCDSAFTGAFDHSCSLFFALADGGGGSALGAIEQLLSLDLALVQHIGGAAAQVAGLVDGVVELMVGAGCDGDFVVRARRADCTAGA